MKTVYNLNGDSHMMKNMEWGAVAYLSHSKYGTCTDGSCVEVGINNNSSYITGCGATAGSSSASTCNKYDTATGMLASTTQNIYGIYDMVGGAGEYVMGSIVNNNGNFYTNNSGFESLPNQKYYDSYIYSTSATSHERGKLGDATKEILKIFGNQTGGWYNDYSIFSIPDNAWIFRGGRNIENSLTGMFYFLAGNGASGNDGAVHAVLCSN